MNRIDWTQYRTNLRLWATGWTRFRELEPFRRPFGVWSPAWWLCYLLDHGTHTLCGGAVVTWSRWAYLQAGIGGDHGRRSMDALWGSKSSWKS